eukprot:EG_transcript_9412
MSLIHNMLRGLNGWSLCTTLWIFAALALGMGLTPQIRPLDAIMWSSALVSVLVLGVVLAVIFERLLRRKFAAERRLAWELQAARMADSVLNHTLKNTLADVAGNVEMFLAGALDSQALEECILSLRRGMRSCKERLVYLKLAAGQYQPVLNAVHLQEFGRQLLAGRCAKGWFPDCAIYADQMLLTLIFDNALSNAAAHGAALDPDVQFSVEELPRHFGDADPGRRRFQFEVTNKADPSGAPLTPRRVQRLFAGVTRDEEREVPVLSDRIGLTHCALAAKLGGIALSLAQEGDLVTFRGVLEAQVAPNTAQRGYSEVPPEPLGFPAGLHFVVLDDSLTAQHLLKFHIERWCQPSSVACFGATMEELDPFIAHAAQADIVIVDQHLNWARAHLGTDIVRHLRQLPFQGFVCIRSAEDGPDDQEQYQLAGANCSMGKDLLGHVMLQQLKEAYEAFRPAKPPSPGDPPAQNRIRVLTECTPLDTRLTPWVRPPSLEPPHSLTDSCLSRVDSLPGCVPPFLTSRVDGPSASFPATSPEL